MHPQEPIFSSQGKAMGIVRSLAMVCCLACSFLPAYAQKQSWLPVTAADMGIKEAPGNPGAPAIQIYYAQNIDDYHEDDQGEYIYRRIKVLAEKGKKYA